MTGKARVLLVEDDHFMRRACEAGLRRRGFEVVSAADGEEGLRMAGSEPHPDVILLDLLMPKVHGLAVLRGLKEGRATADIPVVVLSNSSREEDRERALESGAAGYHVKGDLSLTALAAHVKRLVEREDE